RHLPERGYHQATVNALALTGAGDVVAAGELYRPLPAPRVGGFGIVKFDGQSGEILWRRIFAATSEVPRRRHSVAIDSHEDVLAADSRIVRGHGKVPDSYNFTVRKLRGLDGALRWRRDIGFGSALAVAVDGDDDVVAAGGVGVDFRNGFMLAKLAKTGGAI